MLTVRHIERLWNAQKYSQLLQELISPRIEAPAAPELAQTQTASAAALSLIRLDELHQPHAPLCSKLIRTVVSLQEPDGGWGDVAVTALCLRALSLQNGHGLAIQRGMTYLGSLQQPAGIWPKIPIRRMPADALVSAFVMLQLADNDQFHLAVDFDAAYAWFETHRSPEGDGRYSAICAAGGAAHTLDHTTQALWDHARLRAPATLSTHADAEPSWS
jgi:hypothetical protein